MFSSSSALQLRENTGSWKLKSTFGCCRFEYIKMMHGDASLWESFPQALERRTGARRYVGTFRAPFQDLRLAPSQEHALRVCSLLAIPPPPRDPRALPGGGAQKFVGGQFIVLGGYCAGHRDWDDRPPAGDGSDHIPSFSGASDSPGVGVTGGILSPVLPSGLRLQVPGD